MRCHNNPDDCYREGLALWLDDGEKSWGDLVIALSSPTVGHKDVARQIERDYIHSTRDTPSNIIGPSDSPTSNIAIETIKSV